MYPANGAEIGSAIKTTFGSFWGEVYADYEFIDTFAKGIGLQAQQLNSDFDEITKCVSRIKVPVFHRTQWRKITLKRSTAIYETIHRFGSTGVFGNQPLTGITYMFGGTAGRVTQASLPTDIKTIPLLFNRIDDPSLTLVEGVDYTTATDLNAIVFKDNPFTNPLVSSRTVFDSMGAETDKEVYLWALNSETDKDFIYSSFGYVPGIKYKSSHNYLNFLNAIMDGIHGGSSRGVVENAVSALIDVPLTKSDGEVVEVLTSDRNHKLVITDKNVYKFKLTATTIVTVGQTLKAGEPLVDIFKVYDFSDGTVHSEIPSITIPRSYFRVALTGDLTFVNSSQATTVTTDSGYTKITFPITGAAGDITLFWNTVHTNGITANKTLAHLLDTRTIKEDEPGASVLPATINPAAFIAANVFRNNLIYIRLKKDYYGANALGVDGVKYIKKVIPSHTAVLIQEV